MKKHIKSFGSFSVNESMGGLASRFKQIPFISFVEAAMRSDFVSMNDGRPVEIDSVSDNVIGYGESVEILDVEGRSLVAGSEENKTVTWDPMTGVFTVKDHDEGRNVSVILLKGSLIDPHLDM